MGNNSNNRALQALTNAGADAYKNMYDCRIAFPWATDKGDTEVLTVRAQSFAVPALEIEVADRNYHGVSVKVPTPKQNFERKITLTFRMDASYNLFGKFSLWAQTVGDMVSGGVANWAGAIGKLEVEAINGKYSATDVNNYTNDTTNGPGRPGYDLAPTSPNGDKSKNINPKWTFYDVWVGKVGQPEFDTESNDAITYDVDFYFGDCDYPYFNQTGVEGTGTSSGGAREFGYEGAANN